MALIYNATFDSQTRILSLLDKAGNVISSCEVPSKDVDDITKPLTFKATQDGSTVKLTKSGTPYGYFQTSRDGGKTWTDYSINTAITLNTGDEVSFRAKTDRKPQSYSDYFHFNMTGKIEAWHNVMSLYSTNDFATYESVGVFAFQYLFYNCTSLTKAPAFPATTLAQSCYYRMFDGCQSLAKAPELPATTLASSCYFRMFYGCQSLTKAPELPATTLAEKCYSSMFYGCQSLTKAPELPATTLADYCYSNMFEGCQSLTKAPELPATTITDSCYYRMFYGCQSLTKAPELPATTITDSCYASMFYGCQSLTKAPELPATTLAQSCYQFMFYECQSLAKAPELPATTLATYCYQSMFSGCQSLKEVRVSATRSATNALVNWLNNVSATGDFYCDPNAKIFPTGKSGIPANWRRLNINEEAPAVDDITKPLTFKATQDGSTVTLKKTGAPVGDFQTSRDGGNTWTDYTIDTAITLNTGDEVSFRAKSDRTSNQNYDNYFQFIMEGKIEAWHNVMSLYRKDDFATYKSVVVYAFSWMFKNCTSLTKAPVLPATTLADSCYDSMFCGCQSLTKAPELPATTLAEYCYYSMFEGCQSLAKAPELPATTLAAYCYLRMFYGCRSLAKAPELPATTLASSCYQYMFYECQSLKEVRVSATTTTEKTSLYNWLYGVSATGDFYCDPNATIFPTDSASGIPANWTRRALADYPVTP